MVSVASISLSLSLSPIRIILKKGNIVRLLVSITTILISQAHTKRVRKAKRITMVYKRRGVNLELGVTVRSKNRQGLSKMLCKLMELMAISVAI